MPNKTPKSADKPGAARDTDTSSYAQPHAPDSKTAQNERYEKAPHERDESAKSTGNRLDQQVPPSQRQISQAHDDVESGQVDTDRRGVPDDVPRNKR